MVGRIVAIARRQGQEVSPTTKRYHSTRILDSSCEDDLDHLGFVVAPQGVTSQICRGDQKGPGTGKQIDDAHAFDCTMLDEALGEFERLLSCVNLVPLTPIGAFIFAPAGWP